MSACDAVTSILDLHREGRLTPARAAAVAAHLKSCAACARALEREAPPRAKAPRAPAGFAARLKSGLAAASGREAAPPLDLEAALRPAALAAAGAVLLLAAGALVPGPASQRRPADAGLAAAEAP